MTQVYTAQGILVPVTVLQAGPCTVVATRQPERDGYAAAQLGFGSAKTGRLSKPVQGQFKKAGTGAFAVLREFRLAGEEAPAVGAEVRVGDVFKPGEVVHVAGVTKGRGTAGVMKRHGFAGLPASHGVKRHHRAPGSVGSVASNRGSGRPKKGKRMAGRYGATRTTIRNLRVVRIDPENNLILVRGAVPGPNGRMVMVRPTNKRG